MWALSRILKTSYWRPRVVWCWGGVVIPIPWELGLETPTLKKRSGSVSSVIHRKIVREGKRRVYDGKNMVMFVPGCPVNAKEWRWRASRNDCEELYLSKDESVKRGGGIDERKSRGYTAESGNFYQLSLPQFIRSVSEWRDKSFANSCAAGGPAASVITWELLEMQNLRSYPWPTGSESAFYPFYLGDLDM